MLRGFWRASGIWRRLARLTKRDRLRVLGRLAVRAEPSSSAGTMRLAEAKPSAAANGVACRWETVCVVDAGVCRPHSAVLGDLRRKPNRPRRRLAWRRRYRIVLGVNGCCCFYATTVPTEEAGVSPLLIGSTRQRASDFCGVRDLRDTVGACLRGELASCCSPLQTDSATDGLPGFGVSDGLRE